MDRWQKQGPLTIIAKKFGKFLASQNFLNPRNGAVEEYIQFGQKDWSIILALTEAGNVLTVAQFKQGCDKVILELPAGTTNFDTEPPEAVVRRELRQETGFEAERVIAVGPPQWIASRSSPTRFHPFVATGCKKVDDQKLDASEDIEASELPLREWIEKIQSGEIDEPSSVTTTFLALQHLGISLQYPV